MNWFDSKRWYVRFALSLIVGLSPFTFYVAGVHL